MLVVSLKSSKSYIFNKDFDTTFDYPALFKVLGEIYHKTCSSFDLSLIAFFAFSVILTK